MPAATHTPARRWLAGVVTVAMVVSACSSTDADEAVAADSAPAEVATTEPTPSAADDATTTQATAAGTSSTAGAPDTTTTSGAVQDPLFFGDFTTLDGATVDLADFAGQDVVLWFWAPW